MFLLIEIMNVYGTTRKDSRGSGVRIRAVAEVPRERIRAVAGLDVGMTTS